MNFQYRMANANAASLTFNSSMITKHINFTSMKLHITLGFKLLSIIEKRISSINKIVSYNACNKDTDTT